ncbi:MAG: class I SAM-dependent methyltransferase [Planctomycetota bacterium]|jgi:16S rRNA G1207 methylase RsmC
MNEPSPASGTPGLPPKIEESRLLEVALEQMETANSSRPFHVAGCSPGRGQAFAAIADRFPQGVVDLWYLDLHHSTLATDHARDASGELPANLTIRCAADLDRKDLDWTIVPLSSGGEQELTRDLVQQHYHALAIQGHMIVSVDNPKDRWVHELLKTYEKRIRVRPFADAVVYIVEKTQALKKCKDFSCQLAFRDCDELIQLVTRPGVFSHRELDNGARQLLDAVDVYPEAKLIDIGCGSGSVTLGLAKRDGSAHVHAVDSNARALACLQQGVLLNGLENVSWELNAQGNYRDPSTFDMALANPPYFGNFLIAEKFLQAAHRSLRPGGRLVLVTKQPSWYETNMPRWFESCEVFPSRRYHIASGIKEKAAG